MKAQSTCLDDVDTQRDLQSLIEDSTWVNLGACRKSAFRSWFIADILPPLMVDELKATCGDCPVFDNCDAYRSINKPEAGFWAGRLCGRKSRKELKSNPTDCQMDAEGNPSGIVVLTCPVEVTMSKKDIDKMTGTKVLRLVCQPGEQVHVPGCRQLILVPAGYEDKAEQMRLESPNEQVALVKGVLA